MTGEGLTGEAYIAVHALADCDRILGELGRRRHLFGWLRDPAAGPQQWLAVDAYYPGHRLVVVCRPRGHEHAALFAEAIPAHGLALLDLDPEELPEEPSERSSALGARIAALGELRPARLVAEPPSPPRPRLEAIVSRAVASLAAPPAPPTAVPAGPRAAAAERAARFVTARSPAPPRTHAPPRPRRPRPSATGAPDPSPLPGLLVGLVLIAVLGAETYLAVEIVALRGGELLLAFGIAIDACARALGTIAASRAHSPQWAWRCALGGSPAVATFALLQPSGPVETDPAPLAGLVSLLAMALLAIGLLALLLGL